MTAQSARNISVGPLTGARRAKFHGSGRLPFALPALLAVAVFYLLPTLLNLGLGFTNWNSYSSSISFTGLSNFTQLASSGALLNTVVVTIEFAIITVIAQNLIGFALALGLERTTRFNSVFRVLFFIPVLISTLAAGYIFKALLEPTGPVNALLSFVLGHPVTTPWLQSYTVTLPILALILAWKGMGLTMIIYIAALNVLPGELLESSVMDGANPVQRLVWIRLPLLIPSISFNVVLTLIGALSNFDIPFATTNGGPGNSTKVFNIFVQSQYAAGFYGYATAMSLVLLLVVAVLAVPLLLIFRSREVSM